MEHLGTGLSLTVWGMGLVFLALALLQGLIVLLLHFDRGEAVAEEPAVEIRESTQGGEQPVATEVLAAIAVAVRTHRRTLRRQAAPTMRSSPPSTLGSRWVGAGRTRQNRSWVSGGRHV